MKIIYITNARIPTEKAHGLATIKICEAFARAGADVMLVIPWRRNQISEDPFSYYSAERNFRIKKLPSIDFLWLGIGERVFFIIQLFSFSLMAASWFFLRYFLWGKLRGVVIFSHDHIPLYFSSFIAPSIFYDIHDYPQNNFFYRRVLEKSIGCAVQTKRKIDSLEKDFGVSRKKIVYWPNGTDVARFDMALSKKEARERLGLPIEKKLVVYTGQLFLGRGADTLMETGKFLSGDTVVYIVGGIREDVKIFKERSLEQKIMNVVLVGQRPWAEMPIWLKAADVLVLPHSGLAHSVGTKEVSLYYISPMKLFEYIASGRPIVASNIPSIREIVDETMVFFALSDDPHSFSKAINQVFADINEAGRRAENARKESHKYTWDARAEKILETIRAIKQY